MHASVERPNAKLATDRRVGDPGVGFNPAHMDVGGMVRPRKSGGGAVLSRGPGQENRSQGYAVRAAAVDTVEGARLSGKPPAAEERDFRKKKVAPLRLAAVGLRLFRGFSGRRTPGRSGRTAVAGILLSSAASDGGSSSGGGPPGDGFGRGCAARHPGRNGRKIAGPGRTVYSTMP